LWVFCFVFVFAFLFFVFCFCLSLRSMEDPHYPRTIVLLKIFFMLCILITFSLIYPPHPMFFLSLKKERK
jgi:preprotein translocase subunit SecG